MVTWVVLSVLVFGLLLLALAMLSVLGGLAGLGRAAARTQSEVAQAPTLQASLADLQEQLASLQEHAAGIQSQADARRARQRG